ncbi:DUF6036 family nucleotidyltransferase [Herbiconiux sp. A18JL235]|uniref:DUF6036 family nucleotidyltransferase n=1 Tax=Herbiconiux sp. A18JL235 TaxID=3152363 RepID=A0AB39BDA5_9MICO
MLDRSDLIDGLRDVVSRLRERGEPCGIRIVGGAALSLRYFERRTTEDIDAKIHPSDATFAVAEAIARERGWPNDWLNDNASQFVPIVRDEWEPLYDDGRIGVWVASAPMLLAMKLRASRPGRDDDDIAKLLVICGIGDLASAERHFEEFYPGEVLSDRALVVLGVILGEGLPARPDEPELPLLG